MRTAWKEGAECGRASRGERTHAVLMTAAKEPTISYIHVSHTALCILFHRARTHAHTQTRARTHTHDACRLTPGTKRALEADKGWAIKTSVAPRKQFWKAEEYVGCVCVVVAVS